MASNSTDRRFGLGGSYGIKAPVDLATTGNITLSGEQTIDGVVTDESRVLVWQQTDTTENGIYDTSTGSWTRAIDANGNLDLKKGTLVGVTGGTQAGLYFHITSENPIRPGSLPMVWVQDLTNTTAALRAEMASTASSAVGTGLLGYLRNLAGAVATTLYAWLQRREVDAEDFASIQAALDSGASVVNLTAPSYNLAVGLTNPAGVTLRGRGKAKTTITLTANITPFNVTNVNDAKVEDLLVVAHATQTAPIISLTASTTTIARNKFKGIQVSGSTTNFPFIQMSAGAAFGIWNNRFTDFSGSGLGSVIKLGTTFAGSWIRANTFKEFYVNDFIKGVEISNSAGDGAGENVFEQWGAQTSARTTICVQIPNSVTAENQQNSFHDVAFYDLTGGAVQYSIGTGVRDTSITGATGDPLTPARFTDNGVRTRFTMSPQYLTQLLASGRYQPIPTNATWANTGNTGTATTTQSTSYLQLRTGVTNPSVAFGFTEILGGMNNSSLLSVDFGKKFILGFGISRVTAGASVVGRIQLKNSSAAGPLGAVGLGIQINDLAMTGESYGSALGGVALGNLTDGANTQVMIIHYPGVRTEWWLNGVYTAQQTDATKIPIGTVGVRLIGILGNNSVTDAQMFITQPWMWADLT